MIKTSKNVKGKRFHCCDFCEIGIGAHIMYVMNNVSKHEWVEVEHRQKRPIKLKIKDKTYVVCRDCEREYYDKKERKRDKKIYGL